jgi:hypothetical protein
MASMFLAEPQPTAADLEFSLLRVPVRVSAWFWVAAALLGWNVCQALADGDQRELLRLLVAWVGVVFVSLLVHEFGHALAYRRFGQAANVVLYHFGGLAIPSPWGRRHLRPIQRLIVSAAGPFAQLALAALASACPFHSSRCGSRSGSRAGGRFPRSSPPQSCGFCCRSTSSGRSST